MAKGTRKRTKRKATKNSKKSSKKSKLSLVKSITDENAEPFELDINIQDVENLDAEKLKQNMLRGIYLLEAVLFSQASHEFNRIAKLRKLIKNVEDDVLDEENFKDLKPHQKIRLYQALLGNQGTSLQFLQDLHQNIASGLDAVSQIEKNKPAPEDTDSEFSDADVSEVKKLLQQHIKNKTSDQ